MDRSIDLAVQHIYHLIDFIVGLLFFFICRQPCGATSVFDGLIVSRMGFSTLYLIKITLTGVFPLEGKQSSQTNEIFNLETSLKSSNIISFITIIIAITAMRHCGYHS